MANAEVITTDKHYLIPYHDRTSTVIPNARMVRHKDTDWLVATRNSATYAALRQLGYMAEPTGTLDGYDWCGTKPFKAQIATTELLVNSPRAYVLNGLGTGKTRSALYAYDYLYRKNLSQPVRMLVIAKLSTLNVVWAAEVLQVMPQYDTCVLYGTKEKRQKLLAESKADIYIINHEGVNVIIKELMDAKFDIVVVDEASVIRNKTTRKWKRINSLIQPAKYAWALTATPTPNEPCEAFGIIKAFTPDRAPRYFRQFRDQTMRQVSQFVWVPRENANKTVFDAMQPAVRYRMEDCTDLPPTLRSVREVPMCKDTRIAYQSMVNKQMVEFTTGKITAVNAGGKLNKLLQIASGFIYDTRKGQHVAIGDMVEQRCSVLNEILAEAQSKVLVFVPFRALVDLVAEHFGLTGYTITGDTPASKREHILHLFRTDPSFPMLVCHPGTMSHGLNLTEASVIVWFSPTVSLETYEQANGRIVRPGQKLHQLIVHLQSSDAERRVYAKLSAKEQTQGALLEMFEQLKEA